MGSEMCIRDRFCSANACKVVSGSHFLRGINAAGLPENEPFVNALTTNILSLSEFKSDIYPLI